MSEDNIDRARRGYEAFNRTYRSGVVEDLRPYLEESWDPEIVFTPAGVLPESRPVRGHEGIMAYVAEQMKAFEDGSMWIEPIEFIDADPLLVIPYRFGGTARHTGIELEFSFVHVFEMRDGRAVRADVHETLEQAREAHGLG